MYQKQCKCSVRVVLRPVNFCLWLSLKLWLLMEAVIVELLNHIRMMLYFVHTTSMVINWTHTCVCTETISLPYCTLGSRRARARVSWVGIWRSWLRVQADCGQLWAQTWTHLFYRQKAGVTPILSALGGPGTVTHTRCLFVFPTHFNAVRFRMCH